MPIHVLAIYMSVISGVIVNRQLDHGQIQCLFLCTNLVLFRVQCTSDNHSIFLLTLNYFRHQNVTQRFTLERQQHGRQQQQRKTYRYQFKVF